MFDKYVIVDDSLRDVADGAGEVTGFAFDVRIAYYRGLGLSMVEPFEITVDGEPVPPGDVTFTVHGNTYTFAEMEDETDDRWELAEAATLAVRRPGGLDRGGHDIRVVEFLRISYVPQVTATPCEKVLSVRAAA